MWESEFLSVMRELDMCADVELDDLKLESKMQEKAVIEWLLNQCR